MRTREEIKEIVCKIVKFKRQNKDWDLETMVICIGVVEEYKERAKKILESLKKHQDSIPKEIIGGVKISVITSKVAKEGRQIRDEMDKLITEFLRKECETS